MSVKDAAWPMSDVGKHFFEAFNPTYPLDVTVLEGSGETKLNAGHSWEGTRTDAVYLTFHQLFRDRMWGFGLHSYRSDFQNGSCSEGHYTFSFLGHLNNGKWDIEGKKTEVAFPGIASDIRATMAVNEQWTGGVTFEDGQHRPCVTVHVHRRVNPVSDSHHG